MVHSDAHRIFLQIMTLRRSLDEREASNLMDECCKEFGVKGQTLGRFVQELNLELEPLQLAVRNCIEEREDGDYPCLVLVNLVTGEATRDLSSFSKQELSFMQRLVGEIISTENGEMEINSAINIGLTLPQRMKIGACEELIQVLLKDKWLIKTRNDYGEECVSLSGLSVMELATYLEESHPKEIHKCFFCTKTTFKGYHCDECKISVHRDCGKKYWANRGDGHQCPGQGCNASLLPLVSSSPSLKRSRRAQTEEEDEMMEEEEEETRLHEEEEKREQSSTLRSRRARNII